MPNIRRTFPGRSAAPPVDDTIQIDDEDDDDDDDDDDDEPASGGNATNNSIYRGTGGGKQFGKSLRPPTHDDDVEDDDDDSEEDDDVDDSDDDNDEGDEAGREQMSTNTTQKQFAVRGSGKQLAAAGSGKYLRPSVDADDNEDDDDDDDDDEDDDEEEKEVSPAIKIQPRQGGKNILRMAQPPQDEDDDDDDDDDDDEDDDVMEVDETEKSASVAYRMEGRGGGKSLSRMAPPIAAVNKDENIEDDDDDNERNEIVVQKVVPSTGLTRGKTIRQPQSDETTHSKGTIATTATPASQSSISNTHTQISGGKQLNVSGGKHLIVPRPSASAVLTGSSTISRGPGGGKVLRRPQQDNDDDDDDESAKASVPPTITRGPGGGKTLNRPKDNDKEDVPAAAPSTRSVVVASSTGGGKVLRRPEPDEKLDEPVADVTKKPTSSSIVARSPSGGKVLRRPKDDDDVPPKPKQTIGRSSRGGKQLNRSIVDDKEDDDEDDEDEDEMSLDSDDDDDDDDNDFEEKSPPQTKKVSTRPKRAAAIKASAKTKLDEEIIGDDDIDDDEDEDEELDINNTEALIKDEDDRKYLDSLPELEREAILGERFDKLKEKQDMRKAIAEAKRKEALVTETITAKNKRKAPVTTDAKKKARLEKDEELARKLAGTRSSARAKDVSGAKSKKAAALAALKRQRKIQQDIEESSSDGSELDFGDDDEDSDEDYEEAGLKPWQAKAKAAEKVTGKSSTVSRLDRDDGVDDSDVDVGDDEDDQDPKSRIRAKADSHDKTSVALAGLDDFLKVTIPRRRLARWCNEPFFSAAVLECFVRLFIGEDDKGEKVYRLCEIVDVKLDGQNYKFPIIDKDEVPVKTNKYLRLKFGNNERVFPMNLVSDAPPTELDVQKYLTTQKNNRLECLSKRRATKLRRTQDHLVTTYTYTNADIEESLQQRKKEGKSTSNLGSAQTKIALAVKGARDELQEAERRLSEAKKALMEFAGTPHEEHELEKRIDDCTQSVEKAKKELETLLREEQETLNAVKNRALKLAGREKDQNWAKVNRRALQINQKVDRESYKAQKEIEARKAAGEKEKFNPYARRKVKPKILWEVGQTKDSSEGKSDDHNDVEVTTRDIIQDSRITKAKNSTGFSESNRSTDMSGALVSESHQFVIDEEGLAAQQLSANYSGKSGPISGALHTITRVRKGISLVDYLQLKEKGTA